MRDISSRKNFALNVDEEYLVLSVSQIGPDELCPMCQVVINTARMLGVIEEKDCIEKKK